MTQPILINLHPNVYTQGLCYYQFAFNLDRCVGSCNTLDDLSNTVCVPSKTEDLNLSIFSKITGINESKILTKHIYHASVNASLRIENVTQIKSGITINVVAIVKIHVVARMVNMSEVLLAIQ